MGINPASESPIEREQPVQPETGISSNSDATEKISQNTLVEPQLTSTATLSSRSVKKIETKSQSNESPGSVASMLDGVQKTIEQKKLSVELQNLDSTQFVHELKQLEKTPLVKEMIDYADTLQSDKFKPEIIRQLVIYRVQIREAGITEQFPKKLGGDLTDLDNRSRAEGGEIYDENEKLFDTIRSGQEHSVTDQFSNFCKQNGGNYGLIREWHHGQGANTFSPQSINMHLLCMEFRDVDQKNYYTDELAEELPDNMNKEELKNTLLMNMAYNMEFLTHTDVPGANRDKKTLRVFRVRSPEIMKNNHIDEPTTLEEAKKRHDSIKGSPYESTTIIQSYRADHCGVMIIDVPFHRVVSNYITEPFLQNIEKEFVCMLEGIQFEYRGKFHESWEGIPISLWNEKKLDITQEFSWDDFESAEE